jgi:hypothetical protein
MQEKSPDGTDETPFAAWRNAVENGLFLRFFAGADGGTLKFAVSVIY